MTKLFVVGFPRDMGESELAEIFSTYGQVEKVLIITDVESGESKGYGFVDMTDISGARAAINALDGASIDDRVISVRIKAEKEPAEKVFTTARKRMAMSQPFKPKPALPPGEKKKRPRL